MEENDIETLFVMFVLALALGIILAIALYGAEWAEHFWAAR